MAPTNLQKHLMQLSNDKIVLQTVVDKVDGHTTNALDIGDVIHYQAQAVQLWANIKTLSGKIQLEEPDATKQPDHIGAFKACLELFNKARSGLEKIKAANAPAIPHTASSSSRTTAQITLPKINLPPFSGNANNWITFRDVFTSAVHNNVNISNATKFAYLQSCLVGNAAKLINSLPISDANYDLAWDIVKKRHENKRELFLTVARKFVTHQAVVADNPASLRTLADAANEFTRTADSLGITEKYDAILLFLLAQKLDPASRQFWELSMQDTEIPKSQSLIDFIEQRARSLSASLRVKKSAPEPSPHKPCAFHTTHHDNWKPAKFNFCSGSHSHFQCQVLNSMPVLERQAEVKSKGLCSNCLRVGHTAAACTSEKACYKCSKRHHTLLHMDKSVSFSTDATKDDEESSPITSYHSYYRQDAVASHAMLATALIRLQDSNGGSLLLRVFMDGGSTASFITESCVNRLGLRRYSSSKSVTGMGGSSVGKTKGMTALRFIPLFKSDFNEAFFVEAHIMKKVTNDLPQAKLHATSWSHLKTLKLADPTFDTPSHIDIMLGADIFYDLLLDVKMTGVKNSLVGTNSKLGWLIAGVIGTHEQKPVHAFTTDIEPSKSPASKPGTSRENKRNPISTWVPAPLRLLSTKQTKADLQTPWRNREAHCCCPHTLPKRVHQDLKDISALYCPPHRRRAQSMAKPAAARTLKFY